MKKKLAILLAAILAFSMVTTSCGSKDNNSTPNSTAENTSKGDVKQEPSGKKTKIKFYGRIDEDISTEAMMKELQDHFKDKYEIDPIKVDWDQLDRVIKTGIASGSPADIYFYWPMYMPAYAVAGQAADLTPYLEANDGEWKKTFNQNTLDFGKVNGKYYNVPIIQQSNAFYVNTDLFAQAGVEVPQGEWTWDEFVAACKKIDENTEAFPFALTSKPGDVQAWILINGVLSLVEDKGISEDWVAGKTSAKDEMYKTVMEKCKVLYDNQYVYPGDGAMTISREETKSAFIQGKAAILAEVWTEGKPIKDQCDFGFEVVQWPKMGNTPAVTGGANGFFIPSNAANIDNSVEVLKYYLGTEVQTINASMGMPTANVNVQVDDPITKKLLSSSDQIKPSGFWWLDTRLKDFLDKQLLPEYLLGIKTADQLLDEQEVLRLQALEALKEQ